MNRRQAFFGLVLFSAMYLAFFADKTPIMGLVSASKSPRSLKTDMRSDLNQNIVIDTLAVRERLISSAGRKEGLAMFGLQNWNPLPPVLKIPAAASPPPTAPPLPFQFIGKKFEDGVYEVYLANGEKVYTVNEKTIIENLYRVDSIQPPFMKITYLPLDQSQTLSIGLAE